MADYAIPKINTAYIFYGCLVSQADTKLFKSAPTLASGDFKVSIDGGAFANLATLPTNTPGTFAVKFSLSSSEMNGDNILVVASDAAGAEWCDQCWNIQTAPRGVGDLAFPTVSGRSLDVSTGGEAGVDWANVGSPTTTLALTGTTISTAQKVDIETIKTNPVVNAGTVTFPTGATLASTTNITGGTITTATNVTTVNGLAANVITAASIAAAALNGKGDWNTTTPPTSAAIATAVWTDTTAGDFTTAASIGKSIMNGVALGTGLTINGYTGNTPQTGDSFARIGATGSGLTSLAPSSTALSTAQWTNTLATNLGTTNTTVASNLDATVSSRMASYTQPAGFLAATFPGTVASTTNITAGTITTVTNLTNAPTAGDFTATMKTSLNAATPTVVLSAADSWVLSSGTAASGTSTTLVLPSALGTAVDIVGCLIKITSGTGLGQVRVITGYVNATKTVTVGYAWTTNPAADSVYAILFAQAPKIDSSLKISGVVLADTLTTYTSNTPQTGDSFARIGATGSGLTSLAPASTALSTAQWTNTLATNLGTTNSTVASNLDATVSSRSTLTQTQVTGGAYSVQSASCVLGDARIANLDAAVTSRMATYTQPTGFLAATFPATVASTTNITAGTITTVTNLTNAPTAGDFTATMKTSLVTAIWDSTISGHTTSGTFGGALNAAGAAGDPWNTSLPGAYAAGTAGYIIGTNLDAAVSSRGTSTLTQTQVTGGAYSIQSSSCVLGDARIANLDATITSRMATYTQPTGFLAATFPSGTIANTTNITAGVMTTTTNLTTLPSIPANWITAAGITAGALNGKGDWNTATPPTATENADALLKRDWTAVTGEASRSTLNALRFIRNKFSTTTTPGLVTIYKEDDSTVAYTKSITTDAAAEPIVSG